MRQSTVVAYVLLGGVVLLAGCGKDPVAPVVQQQSSGSSPFTPPPVDLNALLASSTAMSALTSVRFGPTAWPPGNCPYDSKTQMFVCPTSTIGGFTYNSSYQVLDAANQPQSAFDSTTAAAVRAVRESSSSLTISSSSGTVTLTNTNHDDTTLSGLLTEDRVMNGTGWTVGTMSGGPVSFSSGSRRVISSVVLPRGDDRWPQSGTVTVEHDGPGASTRTTATFNGTSTITIRIEGPTGTRTCTVDAENPMAGAKCTSGS